MIANKTSPLVLMGEVEEASMRGFIIGAMIVIVAVLGYLSWDSEHNTLFKAPGVEIKKN